jgi:small GTP-binding protein
VGAAALVGRLAADRGLMPRSGSLRGQTSLQNRADGSGRRGQDRPGDSFQSRRVLGGGEWLWARLSARGWPRHEMTQYAPTIGDMFTKDIELDGVPRHLEIDDTAGQEAYADLRNEKLGTGDGYMLVYAINDDTTFSKLDKVRTAIKATHARDPIVMLVGTKADLEDARAVERSEGEKKAAEWGAKFFEVSAKTNGAAVRNVFESLVRDVLAKSGDSSKGMGTSMFGDGKAPRPDSAVAAVAKPTRRCSIL